MILLILKIRTPIWLDKNLEQTEYIKTKCIVRSWRATAWEIHYHWIILVQSILILAYLVYKGIYALFVISAAFIHGNIVQHAAVVLLFANMWQLQI